MIMIIIISSSSSNLESSNPSFHVCFVISLAVLGLWKLFIIFNNSKITLSENNVNTILFPFSDFLHCDLRLKANDLILHKKYAAVSTYPLFSV